MQRKVVGCIVIEFSRTKEVEVPLRTVGRLHAFYAEENGRRITQKIA